MLENIVEFLTTERALGILRAVILLLLGFLAASIAARLPRRLMGRHFSAHHVMLVRRVVYYGILALFFASALRELGFSLSVLLGAAGVLSVAIGFASQTSASNLISGLFLIAERPFSIGDTISVGGTTGEVLSIDLLSVKLRTPENLYVRIPNEQLIKSAVTTLTRFPIRRLDLKIGVAYKEDISRVRNVLLGLAERNPLCLDEPRPQFAFTGFGDSALDIQFSVWARRERYGDLRDSLQEEIKRAFDEAGIDIPFPHRTLQLGGDGQPLPVRVIDTDSPRSDAS